MLLNIFRRARDRADYQQVEDPDDSPEANENRIAVGVGRLADLAQRPVFHGRNALRDAIQDNPYHDLEPMTDEQYAERGRTVMRNAASTAGQIASGQALRETANTVVTLAGATTPAVQVIGAVPAGINAGHTVNQSRRLHRIAEDMPDALTARPELKQTIRICAYLKGWKTGGQLTSIGIGLGATGVGVGAIAGLTVVTGGLALVPAGMIMTSASIAGGGAGVGTLKGTRKFSRWKREINTRTVAVTLVDCALLDEEQPERQFARRALEALRFDLNQLPESMPPIPEDPDDPNAGKLQAAYADVRDRL